MKTTGVFLLATLGMVHAQSQCKSSPLDSSWPTQAEWNALNRTIDGVLLRTAPAASVCYPGNPLNAPSTCEEVKQNWTQSAYQASLPEGIGAPMFANNSCIPPGADGYAKDKGCVIGGYPAYIVNATSEQQISEALLWAASRNIRIVVKGTGHDLNGRSSGAYALSIWTHNLRNIQYSPRWQLPTSNGSADVIITGSGNNWGTVYTFADKYERVVVGGGDGTVGLGGYLQGGGHGPLSSQFGLGADQIYQATVITTDGRRLIANQKQNQDLFWAIKGGGAGQYGVVTEYVLKAHPAPTKVVSGGLQVYAAKNANADAAWKAVAAVVSSLPDVMDARIGGTVNVFTGSMAKQSLGLNYTVPGAAIVPSLSGYYINQDVLKKALNTLAEKAIVASGDKSSIIVKFTPIKTSDSFLESFGPTTGSSIGQGIMSTRLLGRAELSDISQQDLITYLQQLMYNSSMMLFGLQGGPGTAHVPVSMRGAVNPIWRKAYVHLLTFGISVNGTGVPSVEFKKAAEWAEKYRESVWRKWAPNTGAYMNEANPFNSQWKHDFYGVYYDRLLEIKDKYDPSGSLYVLNGVGSDRYEASLDTGLLCRI
ncbi:hypothetical protein BBP40_000646 [Aspergillus hancockii]|nr:hypothetical protein BBP40_000646 [Aspergillus hancockii]